MFCRVALLTSIGKTDLKHYKQLLATLNQVNNTALVG